jgi:uncharacterized protein (TIGR00299 family) protein
MKKSERKILYIDAFSGVSGDMFLSAIVDCGFKLKDLKAGLASLGVKGYSVSSRHVERHGIRAVKLDIDVSRAPTFPTLSSARELVEKSGLDEAIKASVIQVLECLATAEAGVHGRRKHHVHFHELGDFDTILDLVGVTSGLYHLGVDKVYSSFIPLGRGIIESDHGRLVGPAPATAEILKGVPVKITDRSSELTTPTGAALVKVLASGFTENIDMKVEKIGYGAGSRIDKDLPNLLRVFLGTEGESDADKRVYVLEANIDDMDPQVYTYLFEKLLAEKVMDVYLTPVQMKKARPGILLTVITDEQRLDRISNLILAETTTIGFRYWEVRRRILDRRIFKMTTSLGEVRVKEVDVPGSGIRRKIEYEDLARLAKRTGRNLVDLQRELQGELDRK